MNEDVKVAWVDELLSGRRRQGRRMLRYTAPSGEELWCCLGVLCDLAAEAGVGKWVQWLRSYETKQSWVFVDAGYEEIAPKGYDQHINGSGLTNGVLKWAGLPEQGYGSDARFVAIPTKTQVGSQGTLAWLNDMDLNDFPRIAEEIKNHL